MASIDKSSPDSSFRAPREMVGGILVVVILLNLSINLFIPGIWDAMEDRPWLATFLGLCIGQVNLIAIWGALAPGRLVVRLPWAFALTTLMWYALAIGNRIDMTRGYQGRYNANADEIYQLGVILYASTLVALLPLWLLGGYFRWRLKSPFESPDETTRKQVSMRLLFAGMTLLAMLLAVGRWTLPAKFRWTFMDDEIVVIIPVMAVVNLLFTTPAIYAVFMPWRWAAVVTAGLTLHCATLTGLELAALTMILGPPGSQVFEVYLIFLFANLGQLLAIVSVLLILRALGYELQRGSANSPGGSSCAGNPFRPGDGVASPE